MQNKDTNSRIRLLKVLEILKQTDEDHRLTIPDIQEKLKKSDILSERKAIAKDIASLEEAGYPILRPSGNRQDGFAMLDPLFEEYQWKILADSVAAARFLTLTDSKHLIEQILKATTVNGRNLIKDTTKINRDYKSEDFKNKYKISTIFTSIIKKRQITFKYKESDGLNAKLKNKIYTVSPYALILWHEEYYLIAAGKNHDNPIHYRIERMVNIKPTHIPTRPMDEIEGLTNEKHKEDIQGYIRRTNDLWGGTQLIKLKLACPKEMQSYLRRQFGKSIIFTHNKTTDLYETAVQVYDNDGLYYTLARYGNNIRLIAPKQVKERYITFLKNILSHYE